MPVIRNIKPDDFPAVFPLICSLWDYNTYEETATKEVFDRVLADADSFAFLLYADGEVKGFCHGDYFQTFWMCGLTCYVSSLIVREEDRGKGYGRLLMDEAKVRAVHRGCKAMILDSGKPRKKAHRFYEQYGFEKSCCGFELIL